MSLELALQENTNAVNALIAVLQNATNTSAGLNTSVVISNDKTTTVEVEQKAKPETKAKTKVEAKPETKAKSEPELTYGDISPFLLELAKKDRAKLVDLLKKHGATKGTDLKPEQFAQVKIDVDALLNPSEDLDESLV